MACLSAIGVVAQAVVHQVAAQLYMLIAACTFPAVTAVETMFTYLHLVELLVSWLVVVGNEIH